MRRRSRTRVCSAVMSLLAAILLPLHALAQGGYGPAPAPAPPQSQPPPPEPSQEEKPAPAEAQPARPNEAFQVFDLLIVRPLGFVAVAVGAVLFVPTALITAPMGRDSIQAAKETFITVPTNEVFKRPLGEF